VRQQSMLTTDTTAEPREPSPRNFWIRDAR
jgi:hypothetical protein